MLDKFIPDMYYQSIYRVNYKKLKEKGITLVIFDLDNTIATIDSKVPEKDAINLIKKGCIYNILLFITSKIC